MRTWRDLAAPDDPTAWYAVSGMWPTKRGTYETADVSTGTDETASGATAVRYAFTARALTAVREYVITSKIWEYTGGSLTDRTNGVTVGALRAIMMAQYGDVTICAMGAAAATAYSTGGNFSALAGAPQAEIVVVQSNAVVYFNTNTNSDGWAASDVGDYTNYTTGEAASGRIITTPGPIVAAVPYGNDILVFKKDAIYRMTYVGGVVKWTVQLAWKGMGAGGSSFYSDPKYQVVATPHGVAFNADTTGSTNSNATVYLFDGASPPVLLNPETSLDDCHPVFCYDPIEDVLVLAPATGSSASGTYDSSPSPVPAFYYYYNFRSQAWGSGVGSDAEDLEDGTTFPAELGFGVLQGDYYGRSELSTKPVFWRFKNVTTGILTRCAPTAPGSSSSCYLQTTKDGVPDRKTFWSRLTPLLRRRTDLGTDSVSLSVEYFREREDTATTATATVSESSQRKRFDFTKEENYARFKVTWTALDVEVDDFLISKKQGGLE